MTETPKRAAIIDDNLMFAMMIEPGLKRLGYQVRTLGAAALDAAAAFEPHIVFVNLAARRPAGSATVQALRAHERLAPVPIVGYAGHVERQLLQAGRDAGADLVVPNSAVSKALPEVLAKLARKLAGGVEEEWPGD